MSAQFIGLHLQSSVEAWILDLFFEMHGKETTAILVLDFVRSSILIYINVPS